MKMKLVKILLGVMMAMCVFLSDGYKTEAANEMGDVVYQTVEDHEESNDNEIANITEGMIKKITSTDELFEMRNRLIMEDKNNEYLIDAIDKQLENLGVEEISSEEAIRKIEGRKRNIWELIYDKLGKYSPVSTMVALEKSNTVKWTSKREKYVYRGQTFEMQIIQAVPRKNVNSELWGKYSISNKNSSSSKRAIEKKVFEVIMNESVSHIPIIGTTYDGVLTAYEAIQSVNKEVKKTAIVSDISANYTLNLITNWIYVYVKYSGSSDSGNQVLTYVGNTVMYETTVVIPTCIYDKKNSIPRNIIKNISGELEAKYYNNFSSIACEKYYFYKNMNVDFSPYYDIRNFKMRTVEDTVNIAIPRPYNGY